MSLLLWLPRRGGRSPNLLPARFASFQASASSSPLPAGPQNLVEKIVQRHALGIAAQHRVHAGDFIAIKPAHVMTHDNTWAVMAKFATLTQHPDERSSSNGSSDSSSSRSSRGCSSNIAGSSSSLCIADPRQPVLALDHNVQDRSDKNLARYAAIEAFAKQHGLDFFPAGRGIGHQVLCEEGYVQPGWMVVASDSHSNMYGALGALGTPVVRTDAAAIWATGTTWWQVPPVARVQLEGKLPRGVTGKDVILSLCGLFAEDHVLNHAVEFTGEGVECLGMEDRMTISNMTTEWGALAAVFPIDAVTVAWVQARAARLRAKYGRSDGVPVPPRVRTCDRIAQELAAQGTSSQGWEASDQGAYYAQTISLDLSRLCSLAAGPNAIKLVTPVRVLETQRVAIQKAYIVSCVNSRVSDLAAAAAVLRGQHIAPGVELYIAAASSEVEKESKARGDWQALVAAGAIELPSGCGPCVGLGRGLLKDGEVAISATNRNFRGRMGSRSAQAYLASPNVVAQSAMKGYIACVGGSERKEDEEGWRMIVSGMQRHHHHSKESGSSNCSSSSSDMAINSRATTTIIKGFPPLLRGPLLLTLHPNIDTDGIYAGKHCYEDLNTQAQASVAMENYDPSFASLVQKGDILVTGPNFGCGSSREQAATALRACGIQVILATSVNETFRRNALNNALVVLEVPALVSELNRRFSLSPSAGKGGKEQHQQQSLPTSLRLADYRIEVDFVHSVVRLVSNKEQRHKAKSVEENEFPFTSMGPVVQEIVVAGGLEGWVRRLLQKQPPPARTK
ncbi:homoaconitate hydratase [Nannochloropsis oceanica]